MSKIEVFGAVIMAAMDDAAPLSASPGAFRIWEEDELLFFAALVEKREAIRAVLRDDLHMLRTIAADAGR